MSRGLSNAGFDIDLKNALAREGALAHKLTAVGINTIEHKDDNKYFETGNVFIEFRQKGRPSGISTTTADMWAFEYYPNHWLLVPTDVVKKISREELIKKGSVFGGDYNEYEGVLVPLVRFIKYCRG